MQQIRSALVGKLDRAGQFTFWVPDRRVSKLDGSYVDIFPLVDANGFRLHVYRDRDNLLKVDLRTLDLPRGTMKFPLANIPNIAEIDKFYVVITWSREGASLWLGPPAQTVDTLGHWKEPPQGKTD